jgi:hypothetical protein
MRFCFLLPLDGFFLAGFAVATSFSSGFGVVEFVDLAVCADVGRAAELVEAAPHRM